MSEKYIYFVKLPSIRQLCHVVLKVPNGKILLHTQVVKCRQLLFLSQDVLAAPHYRDKFLIDAVVHADFYKKNFGVLCQKLGLQPVHTSVANTGIVERCVLYTINFRLAPHWNQVAQILVSGKDFLNCGGKMEAVNFDVTVTENEIILKIKAYQIRLPPPRLENFGICPEAIEKFNEDHSYEIPEFAINLNWCFILPTMNRGQLVGINRRIPQGDVNGNVLKDYAGLRRYWKSQYGYHVPEANEDTKYCSVYFGLIGADLFTYPLICLRNRSIQYMPRCDSASITKNFFLALHSKFTKLCGLPVTYSGKACSAITKLSNSILLKPGLPQNVTVCKEQPLNSVSEAQRVPCCTKSQTANTKAVSNEDVRISQTTNECANKSLSVLQTVPNLDRNASDYKIKKALQSCFTTTSEGKYKPVFTRKKMPVHEVNRTPIISEMNGKIIKISGNNAKKKCSTGKVKQFNQTENDYVELLRKKQNSVAAGRAHPSTSSHVGSSGGVIYCASNAQNQRIAPPLLTGKKHKFDEIFISGLNSKKPGKRSKFDEVFSSASSCKQTTLKPEASCKKLSTFHVKPSSTFNTKCFPCKVSNQKTKKFDDVFCRASTATTGKH